MQDELLKVTTELQTVSGRRLCARRPTLGANGDLLCSEGSEDLQPVPHRLPRRRGQAEGGRAAGGEADGPLS